MKLKQISIFLENRPGHLSRVCESLAKAGINITTMTLADTREFGILRMIIRDWEMARTVLQDAGFTVNLTDVLAVEIADEPGGLEKVLKTAEAGGLSIEYIYAAPSVAREKTVLILRCDDLHNAWSVFCDAGVRILQEADFFATQEDI